MAKRQGRTQEHRIADEAVKHVELAAAEAGFVALGVPQGSDYGIDLPVSTFNGQGVQENGYLFLQIKASRKLNKIVEGQFVTATIQKRHILHWSQEPMPVILVRYDAAAKTAYWLYVQRYLAGLAGFDVMKLKGSLSLRIPVSQKISSAAFLTFAEFKRNVILQLSGKIDHG